MLSECVNIHFVVQSKLFTMLPATFVVKAMHFVAYGAVKPHVTRTLCDIAVEWRRCHCNAPPTPGGLLMLPFDSAQFVELHDSP